MKNFLLIITVIFSWASCRQTEPAARMPKQFEIEQLFDNQSIFAADFSVDESKILLSNNKSGIFNVYELNTADTSMKPLTGSTKESFFAVAYLPNSTDFIYSSDNGGDENSHLFLVKQGGKSAQDLTNWPQSSNSFFWLEHR